MVTNYCRMVPDPGMCRTEYFTAMAVLLLIYMPIDIVQYLAVKFAYE